MTDCRRCRSYSRGWCSAAEQTVRHPTAGRCSYYEGPSDPDAPRCEGGCGDLVADEGDWCAMCWDVEQDHRDAEAGADERRTP